jgi:heme/copper-type cytochrome/quinol oxidase subunit 4
MLIAGFNFFIGFACGLRLTLVPFILVMLIALVAEGALIFSDIGVLSAIGQLALAAFCLQAGYVGGVLARARVS